MTFRSTADPPGIRVFTALRVNTAASNRRIDRPKSAVKPRMKFSAVFA